MRNLLLLPILGLCMTSVAQDSLNVHKLFHWDDPSIPVGNEGLQNQYSEIWGYAAAGREYAIIGSSIGTHVFDVTEPALSSEVGYVAGRVSGNTVVHRDYKTYQGYLYAVCDEGPSSLQIIDLHYLPDSVHVVYDSDALLVRAHNIQVDTVNARLYTCGGSTQFSVFSLADPELPVLLSDCEADIPWWGPSVGYVHDCFVRENIVWCNDQDGLHVVDFSDVDNPVLLGSLMSYPDQGYNHSGWMNDAGTLYAMADETHGSPLKFVDPSDLSDLQVVSTVTSGVDPTSIVHNPFYKGDVVHVAYYYDGYWAWNTADPLQPMLVGYYDTNLSPNSNGYRGAWGVYPWLPSGHILVSDLQTGLWVLQLGNITGIPQGASAPTYRIAPTVTSGPVRITPLPGAATQTRVIVHDAAGRSVRTLVSQGTIDLDLSGLGDGIYVIHASDERGDHVQRILKTSLR